MKSSSKKMAITLGMVFSLGVLAAELPKVSKPEELISGEFSEGTITQMSSSDIEAFLPWAQNAKKTLQFALEESKRLSITERVEFISTEMKAVVSSSGTKQYQMLMRFALNRGLLLVNILDREADRSDLGVIENQLDILSRSINVAMTFYESDMSFLKKINGIEDVSEINFAEFGTELGKNFIEASKNIFDISAQYHVLLKSFEMMNWDLSQDKDAILYSDTIIEIFNTLERFPKHAVSDEASLKYVRGMNRLYLNVTKNLTGNLSPSEERDPNSTSHCGLQGSIGERIRDCSYQLTSKKKGFVLVTRTIELKEIYKDTKTGLLWGDRLPETMNRYEAQEACKADFAEVASGLIGRLPSKKEFKIAAKNEITLALPDMNKLYWSSQEGAVSHMGYAYTGAFTSSYEEKLVNIWVRCVVME